jgi:serine/threonine protein kinase
VTSRAEESGLRLGRYELLGVLGRGGMATVHLARREGRAELLAIKVVHDEHRHDRNFVRMLLDEARVCACIRHPNVVEVLELGEARGVPYLVMEYIDGVRLVDVMRAFVAHGRTLEVDVVAAIASRIASGLHAAHEGRDEEGRPLEIVHRDVSPHNVLITSAGEVKLIDFGIARAVRRLAVTEPGSVKGKVAYLSPEQIAGHAIDRRSDIFALGIVTWELLTMRRLFHTDSHAITLMRIREGRFPPARTYRPELPAAIDDVLAMALARDPSARFQSAAAFRRAFRAACPALPAVTDARIAAVFDETCALSATDATMAVR